MGGKMSLVFLLLLGVCICKGSAQSTLLRTNFYANSCPNVEAIVRNVVSQKFSQTFVTVPGTLRLFFHDCFVEGCDASVIIQSTANNQAEKDFQDNLSLAGDGFDTVTKAKQAVENVCPNTVSCADILAIATRDVINLAIGHIYYQNLMNGKGLFLSDQVLFTDNRSRNTVQTYARDPSTFNANFIQAITNLGRVGVKVGNQGEIRKDCSRFN